jgi:hypothetical protein
MKRKQGAATMKYISIILLHVVFVFASLAQTEKNDYPFKEKYSFDGSDCGLEIKLETYDSTWEIGKRYLVKYTINVTNGFCKLYSPFFNGLIPHPGQFALYDKNKNYLINLTQWKGGSRRSPGKGDWVFINGGSFIGGKKSFTTGDSLFSPPINTLKEGTYYLQLIFYQGFVSTPWEDIVPEQNASYFYKTFSKKELCRSNAIEINIIKAK